jgi:outer membrane receptor for ferrienterochelin and colicin
MLIILKQLLFTSSAYLIAMIVFVFSQNAKAQNATASSEPTKKLAYTNMQEITVTAKRTNREVSDVPESVSVVDTEQLQTRQAADIGDVLRYLPNVELGGGPRNLGMNPNIRGLGDARILLLLDGARQDVAGITAGSLSIQHYSSGLISYVGQHHPLGAVAPWVE